MTIDPNPILRSGRCPRCGAEYSMPPDETGMIACSEGHRAYSGYVAEAAALAARLDWLTDRVAAGDPAPDPLTARRYGIWPSTAASTPGTSSGVPPLARRWGAQVILLALGAGLLIIAGAVFTAVVWHRLGALGQVALMLIATTGFGALGVRYRSRLPGTSAAMGVVAFGLLVVDEVAAPALGLLPKTWLDVAYPYPFVAALVAAGLTLWLGRVSGIWTWVWAGWLSGAVGAGLLSTYLAVGVADQSQPGAALSVSVAALAAVTLLGAPYLWPRLRADQRPLSAAGLLATLFAVQGWVNWLSDVRPATLAGTLVTTVVAALAVGALWGRTRLQLSGLATLVLAGLGLGLALLLAGESTAVGWAILVAALGAVGLAVAGILGRPTVGLLITATMWATWVAGRVAGLGGAGPTPAQIRQFWVLGALIALCWFVLAANGSAPEWAWPASVVGEAAWLLAGRPFTQIEQTTLPFAALLIVAGYLWHRGLAGGSSAWELPGISVGLVPSAVACWGAPWVVIGADQSTTVALMRLGGVLVAGLLLAVPGARGREVGLLLPAGAALAIAGLAQLASGLTAVPRWLALSMAGTALVLAGARLEWLRGRGREFRSYLSTLH